MYSGIAGSELNRLSTVSYTDFASYNTVSYPYGSPPSAPQNESNEVRVQRKILDFYQQDYVIVIPCSSEHPLLSSVYANGDTTNSE